jgi:3-deoxy-D-manno-octulosonate 8-phosphate phosphatase (KDO 8-P phosphatase)
MTDVPSKSTPISARLLVLDVDGVLTDGSISVSAAGDELKTFHVRDGSAIVAWHSFGGTVAIISGRSCAAVDHRASELGIRFVRQGVGEKRGALEAIAAQARTEFADICAIGDDWADLPILTAVGFPVAVADACPEVRAAAKYVTMAPGGRGAVREVVELILRSQGRWDEWIGRFHARA